MKGVDLHIHTVFSDSSLTPQEVVEEAVRAGLEAIAITDHDSIDGIEPALEHAKDYPVEVIPGVELATTLGGKEIHILGYFVDYTNRALQDALGVLKLDRVERAREIVTRLVEHGIPISFEKVKEIAGNGVVARPHIARAMIEEGLVSSYSEAFTRYIADGCPCCVAKRMLDYTGAIRLVREVRGIPVLAHPKDERTMSYVPELISCGLAGVEVWHPDHSSNFIDYLLSYTEKNGLIATGGSDCHGAKKGKPLIGKFRLPFKMVEDLRKYRQEHFHNSDPS
jgi:predicted metal-dependent phosphoesterase TrpH